MTLLVSWSWTSQPPELCEISVCSLQAWKKGKGKNILSCKRKNSKKGSVTIKTGIKKTTENESFYASLESLVTDRWLMINSLLKIIYSNPCQWIFSRQHFSVFDQEEVVEHRVLAGGHLSCSPKGPLPTGGVRTASRSSGTGICLHVGSAESAPWPTFNGLEYSSSSNSWNRGVPWSLFNILACQRGTWPDQDNSSQCSGPEEYV